MKIPMFGFYQNPTKLEMLSGFAALREIKNRKVGRRDQGSGVRYKVGIRDQDKEVNSLSKSLRV